MTIIVAILAIAALFTLCSLFYYFFGSAESRMATGIMGAGCLFVLGIIALVIGAIWLISEWLL